MNRRKLERDVGDITHAAADLGETTAASVGEIAQAANDLARVALAQAEAALHQAQRSLAQRAQGVADQAQDALAHMYGRVRPYAQDAGRRSARFAADRVDAWEPRIDLALGKVPPAVDEVYARVAPLVSGTTGRIQHELLPRLSQVLHEAAGDVVEVEDKKRSAWGTVGKVALAGALVAGVAFAVKKFLEPQDSGWQAHEPSTPYVPPTATTVVDDLSAQAQAAEDAAREWIEEGTAAASDAASTLGDEPVTVADAEAEAETPLASDDADTTESGEGDAAPFARSPYGEGSYVGDAPMEGYTIKGNERSMKYHVEGNAGYARTIADVWFNSEDAAQQAGFTKAQR